MMPDKATVLVIPRLPISRLVCFLATVIRTTSGDSVPTLSPLK